MIMVTMLAAFPILLVTGLAVRFAGTSRVLNLVDYSQIANVPGLNRWAGNRLLLLPATSLFLAVLSWRVPNASAAVLAIFVISIAVVVTWVAVGSSKFKSAGTAGSE
jgi:hypothetical protein